jgi:hypothetical protein
MEINEGLISFYNDLQLSEDVICGIIFLDANKARCENSLYDGAVVAPQRAAG